MQSDIDAHQHAGKATEGKTASGAPRTMQPVVYTQRVGQWRIQDEHKPREDQKPVEDECKRGGAPLTTLTNYGNDNRLV